MIVDADFFEQFLSEHRFHNALILQPRMGFSSYEKMYYALSRLSELSFPILGTITLDSLTRNLKMAEIGEHLRKHQALNGYPIIHYGRERNQELIKPMRENGVPVQIRHGSPQPFLIFKAMIEMGVSITEGGPISYCLPYSRVPLNEAIEQWYRSCLFLAESTPFPHVETFGGCLMGQLCPPALLLSVAILEAIFFIQCNIESISLSYAQGCSLLQDWAALSALRKLAREYLPEKVRWHCVLYTYMGVFPKTVLGALNLLQDSVLLARMANVERLVVKTMVEAFKIPEIEDTIFALNCAHTASLTNRNHLVFDKEEEEEIYDQAKSIIDAVLNINNDLKQALLKAFDKGILDIPFCLHPNNFRHSECTLSTEGYLKWTKIGNLPFKFRGKRSKNLKISSENLLSILTYMQRRYDNML